MTVLTHVRHGRGENSRKYFRISSGDGRVCTTFAIEFKTVGDAQAELLKQGFLLGRGFGDTAQTDLSAVSGGKDNGGALQRGQQREGSHGRRRLSRCFNVTQSA